MTHTITCDVFNERLLAYLEHETDDPTRAAMERHAVMCGECGPLLADLRKLRVDAANLPVLAPSHDLWSGISARIGAPVLTIGSARRASAPAPAPAAGRWPQRALVAASLLAAAGIGYFTATRRLADAPRPLVAQAPGADTRRATTLPGAVASAPVAAVAQPAAPATRPSQRPQAERPAAGAAGPVVMAPVRPQAVEFALATLNADYDREIARLRVLIDQRRNQLDPVTVAIVEKNLQVIDTAIVECRRAIARDPASRFLIESLNQSLQSKLELMRTAALLPSRT